MKKDTILVTLTSKPINLLDYLVIFIINYVSIIILLHVTNFLSFIMFVRIYVHCTVKHK